MDINSCCNGFRYSMAHKRQRTREVAVATAAAVFILNKHLHAVLAFKRVRRTIRMLAVLQCTPCVWEYVCSIVNPLLPFQWLKKNSDGCITMPMFMPYSESECSHWMRIFRSNKTNSENIHWCQTTQMRVLLLYCFWSHALCVDVGFFPHSLLRFPHFYTLFWTIFFHLFCYLVVMSLPVYGPTKRQLQTMTTTTTIQMYLYTKCQLSFALLLTCSLTSMLSTVHVCVFVCVNCRHMRSSGREAMLVTHSRLQQYKCKKKRKGGKRSKTQKK